MKFIRIFLLILIIIGVILLITQKMWVPSLVTWILKTEHADTDTGKIYKNVEYGFEIDFPDSWKGFSVVKNSWEGQKIDSTITQEKYTGPLLVFENPQTNSEHAWQNIPIMVFTADIWKLIIEEKIAVSAAPIAPAKIGENSKYVFATPPRWYGFTDAEGWQEAVDIVKTFKTLDK
ncbi:hypothetical protein KW782_04845 [Candidatus Parcubacteria bacterium]|nr:hypothetical protein [Candidatus Parcubacteria bacterium]